MLIWPAKDPDETLSCGIDWTSALSGDTIVSSTLVVTSGGATISAFAFDDNSISATITGGVDGVPTYFTNRITTAGGFTYEETAELPIITSAFPVGPSTTTKQTLVNMVFEEVGLAGYEFDATPEEQQTVLRRMDALMRTLQGPGNNLALGYNFPGILGEGDLSDPSGIQDDAVDAIVQQTALRFMPAIGKAMSAESRLAYTQNMSALRAAYTVIPERILTRTTPRGSGRPGAVWRPFGYRSLV